jgi:hypothetical protein
METPPTLLAVPWEPTPTIHVWMTILSTVVALVAGCVAFVLPFAVHMAGCIGDWFLVAIALRAPRGRSGGGHEGRPHLLHACYLIDRSCSYCPCL